VSCVYILRCSDNTLYVGHTDDVAKRLQAHNAGQASTYTAARRPVSLVYTEAVDSQEAAIQRERQLKRWSGQKKEALIAADFATLTRLARRRRR
jgi:predicted GIY-YIG superfamily endonuclease